MCLFVRCYSGGIVHYFLGCRVSVPLAMGIAQRARHYVNVITLVSIWREWHVDAIELQIAQPSGQHENVHLAARVVDVVLAHDVEPGGGQHIGETRAVRGAAAMAHVQRTSWVGGHKFDLHFLLQADVTFTVTGACSKDMWHDSLFGR